MKTLVRVLAQYTNENGKLKGGQEFTFRADSYDFMYAPEEIIIKSIQKLLDIQDEEWCGHHTYVSHELVFHEPIELKGDFDNALQSMYRIAIETDKELNS
jgi:hypothetical protein